MTRPVWFSLIALLALTKSAAANPLMGNVESVQATPFGAQANPANYGFALESQFQAAGGLKYSSAKFRVPGADTLTKSGGGFSVSGIPTYIFKLTPNLGLSVLGFALPSPLSAKLNDIPILLFNQVNHFNAKLTLKSVAYFSGGMGFRLRHFGIGGNLTYINASGEMDIGASDSGTVLANVGFNSFTITSVRVGARFDLIPGHLALGAAANAFTLQKIGAISISSPLASALPDGAANSASSGDGLSGIGNLTTPTTSSFDEFLFGWGLAVGSVMVFTDFDYKKKPADPRVFSLSKFKITNADSYDTMAFRGGGKIILPRFSKLPSIGSIRLIGGAQYEPSDMGPGESGPNGRAGFSPLTLVPTNFGSGLLAMAGDTSGIVPLGLGSKVPFTAFSGGIEFEAFRRDSRERSSSAYKLTLAGGLYYRLDSIGVDKSGDSPFAFEKQTIGSMGSLIYRF